MLRALFYFTFYIHLQLSQQHQEGRADQVDPGFPKTK